jgi:hypothetical protein
VTGWNTLIIVLFPVRRSGRQQIKEHNCTPSMLFL